MTAAAAAEMISKMYDHLAGYQEAKSKLENQVNPNNLISKRSVSLTIHTKQTKHDL